MWQVVGDILLGKLERINLNHWTYYKHLLRKKFPGPLFSIFHPPDSQLLANIIHESVLYLVTCDTIHTLIFVLLSINVTF
jgi:hypothetical protein